jgi:hypothetical protein
MQLATSPPILGVEPLGVLLQPAVAGSAGPVCLDDDVVELPLDFDGIDGISADVGGEPWEHLWAQTLRWMRRSRPSVETDVA